MLLPKDGDLLDVLKDMQRRIRDLEASTRVPQPVTRQVFQTDSVTLNVAAGASVANGMIPLLTDVSAPLGRIAAFVSYWGQTSSNVASLRLVGYIRPSGDTGPWLNGPQLTITPSTPYNNTEAISMGFLERDPGMTYDVGVFWELVASNPSNAAMAFVSLMRAIVIPQ